MTHLDTNFLIAAARRGSPERQKLENWILAGEEIGISTCALAEFLCGPVTTEDEAWLEILLSRVETLQEIDARRGAWLFNQTGRRSRTLFDCLIAALALRRGAAVATANVADFQPFVPFGLRLV